MAAKKQKRSGKKYFHNADNALAAAGTKHVDEEQ